MSQKVKSVWSLLFIAGLCSCASSYIPPTEGPTAKIREIRYHVSDSSLHTNLDVMMYDIDDKGCLVNAQKVPESDPAGVLVPANKTVGMSFMGTGSIDTLDISYQTTCDMRFGAEFEQGQEYIISVRQGNQGCSITALNTRTFRPVQFETTEKSGFQGYCIAEDN